MAGIEQIPLRIPDRWDPVWFERFVREVLAKADARNAIPGLGITIEGTPDTPATISSNTDVDQLVDQNYIVAEPSPLLANARTLDGEGGVIEVNDSGPGGIVRISVAAHGISYSKFRLGRPCSVVGRPDDSVGEQTSIEAAANDTVLRRVNDELSFGPVTFPMVQLSGESLLLGRGAGDGAGSMQEITLGTGLSMDGTTLNATGGGGGGGGGALVYVNTSIPSGNTIANTASETAFDSTYTIPADTLEEGMIVRVRLFGVFSTTGTPTLRLRIKLDASTYIDTGAITLPSSVTDMGFCIDAQLVVHSDGATGEIDAQGVATIGLTASTGEAIALPNTATITTDTTEELTVSVTAEWSAADPDNTVTLREMAVWLDGIVAPAPPGTGSITIGTVTSISSFSLDLTTEGDVDWFAWGATAVYAGTERKKRSGMGITKRLWWSDGVGSGTSLLTSWGFAAAPSFSALDAYDTPSSGTVTTGVFRSCDVGDSLFLVIDAGPDERILRIYMSNAFPIDVYATLSDGTSDQSLAIASPGSANCYIPITFQAGSHGQQLLVEIRKVTSSGNLGFSVATVAAA